MVDDSQVQIEEGSRCTGVPVDTLVGLLPECLLRTICANRGCATSAKFTFRLRQRRTETCKGSAQVPKDWGLGVASLALDRELCLHIKLSYPSTQSTDECTGDEEDWRDEHNYTELHQHLQG